MPYLVPTLQSRTLAPTRTPSSRTMSGSASSPGSLGLRHPSLVTLMMISLGLLRLFLMISLGLLHLFLAISLGLLRLFRQSNRRTPMLTMTLIC